MEKLTKIIIILLFMMTLISFSFSIGYLFGEFNTMLKFSDYLKNEEVKENNNITQIYYINQTCKYDERDLLLKEQEMIIRHNMMDNYYCE